MHQTRRQLLASAVPAIAVLGTSSVVRSGSPSQIARLVAEFDAALDRSIRAEKDYNTDRPDADFDADCEAEDAFSEVFVAAMDAGERLVEAVRAIDPDAESLMTPTALYVFDSEVDGVEGCVRRVACRKTFTI